MFPVCLSLLVTGLMLRCDVFVDKVHKIEITTTTRELLLGESPEVFDVQAFDEEGEDILGGRGGGGDSLLRCLMYRHLMKKVRTSFKG